MSIKRWMAVWTIAGGLGFSGVSAGEEFRLEQDRLWLEVREEPLPRLLERFALAGIQVQLDPAAQKMVTASVQNQDIEQALSRLLEPLNYHLDWRREDGPHGERIRLTGIRVFRVGRAADAQTLCGIRRIETSPDGKSRYLAREILVGFGPGSSSATLRAFLARTGGTVIDAHSGIGLYRILLPEGANIPEMIAQLGRDPDIVAAEPNFAYSLPRLLPGTPSTPVTAPWSATESGTQAVVAVLDSGLAPDSRLSSAVVGAYDATRPGTPLTADPVGHGTLMAQLASGLTSPEGQSIAGGVPVLAIKAFEEDGQADAFTLMNAITYAVQHSSGPISLSWGSETPSRGIAAAVQYASNQGRPIFAAGGNRSSAHYGVSGRYTAWGYDALNRIVWIEDNDNAWQTSYDYDLNGNPIYRQYPTGVIERRTFDAMNRLLTMTTTNMANNGWFSMAYHYDAVGSALKMTQTSAGLDGQAQDAVTTWAYDPRYRLTNETVYGAAATDPVSSTSYTWDSADNRRSKVTALVNGLSTQVLSTVVYSNNSLNQLTEQQSPGSNIEYKYDANGCRLSKTVTIIAPEKVSVSAQADFAGSGVYTYKEQRNGRPYYQIPCSTPNNYGYNKDLYYDGSKWVLESRPTSITPGIGSVFAINTSDALMPPDAGWWTGLAGPNMLVTYDPVVSGTTTTEYVYDEDNRLVEVSIGPNAQSLTPNAFFSYDYRSRRYFRSTPTETNLCVFDGGLAIQEYDASDLTLNPLTLNTLTTEYTRGEGLGGGVGGMVYSIKHTQASGLPPQTSIICSHANHRGDVIARSSDTGSLTSFALYEAYGTRPTEWSDGVTGDPDRQKANTKEEETDLGLLNEGMRYRDLETGTFLTGDPSGFKDGPNRYCYVHCNPITHFDALGLSDIFIDGTANDPNDGTNIHDMYEKQKEVNENVHYFEGPKEKLDGGDTMSIVQSAYDQIAKNYAEGDKEINIFGFSRGGAAANELAWMINDKGIVGADGTVLAKPGEAQVGFLGMFDPVHSMGLPGGDSDSSWHDKTIAPNVGHAAIAYAKDETRNYFLPSMLQRSEGSSTTLTTAWFPGYHSDVGGHDRGNRQIGQLTQMFMGAAADHAGMNVHPDYAATVDNLRSSERIYQNEDLSPKLQGRPQLQLPNPLYLGKAIPFNDSFEHQKFWQHSERQK